MSDSVKSLNIVLFTMCSKPIALTVNLRKNEGFDFKSFVVRALKRINELDLISSFSFHVAEPNLPENK